MKYNILDHSNISIVLFRAFINTPGFKDTFESGKGGIVDLKCTINGMEVDLIRTLDEVIKEDINQRKIDLATEALNIVHQSGLDELLKIGNLLHDARHDIKRKIEEVTGVQIDMDDN